MANSIEIRGAFIAWTVSPTGIFQAEMGGENYTAETLEALREKLMTASRKAAVKMLIPVVRINLGHSYNDDQRLLDYVITGKHGHTKNVMVRPKLRTGVLGPVEQLSGYSERFLRDLRADERKEGELLLRAYRKASSEWEQWRQPREINPSRLVEDELNKAVRDGER
jgi:hypothetical protein